MLDFTQRKKRKFEVKLSDGFIALIPTPSKAIFDRVMNLETIKSTDEIYELVHLIINLNQKKKYSFEQIGKIFDFEDAVDFIKEYVNFIKKVISDPN